MVKQIKEISEVQKECIIRCLGKERIKLQGKRRKILDNYGNNKQEILKVTNELVLIIDCLNLFRKGSWTNLQYVED